MIAGKKCSIFTATRISQDAKKHENNYAIFKASQDGWPEFQLYVVKGDGKQCDIFVVPRNHLTVTTSAALDHPELARYKNAWTLLTADCEALARIPPIQWREPEIPPAPTKHSLILAEVIRATE